MSHLFHCSSVFPPRRRKASSPGDPLQLHFLPRRRFAGFGLGCLLLKAAMATIPDALIWEIVRNDNAFLVKQFGRGNAKLQFSKEKNNLYNVHSFKYSGLANKKTISIQPAGNDLSIVLATTKKKKQNKPATASHKSVMKKEFNKMAKAVINQVSDNYYRPDLKRSALARLSVVRRSLQVAKSGPKKRNRQAN